MESAAEEGPSAAGLRMDQETALELVKKGATLLLLDVPQYTHAGSHGEVRYCEAVKQLEFDRYLGPYALDRLGEWKQISCYITKSTIERIVPVGGEISIAYETSLIDTVPKTAAERSLTEQLRNSKFSRQIDESHKQGCYYTSIPHLVKHPGAPIEELTAMNLDKTQLLETILMRDFGGTEDLLLGELQFAFVAFLMGQSLQAFHQWKSLVSLLLSCTEAPFKTRTQLFTKFIRVIYYQLAHGFHGGKSSGGTDTSVSLSLDDFWLSKDTFLNHLCKDFFSLVEQAPTVDGRLLSWTRKLKSLLETKFGWDFQDNMLDNYEEDDEFSPVIVLPNDVNSGEAQQDEIPRGSHS